MKLNIQLTESNYDVIIEKGCIQNVSRYSDLKRNIFIITDTGIPNSLIEMLQTQLPNAYVYRIEAGEQSKSFDN
jgi:3-dehydroquinate synthetase